MARARVEISFLTREPTDSWRVGEALLESLVAADGRLEPDLAGFGEDALQPIGAFPEIRQWWVPSDGGAVGHAMEWKRSTKVRGHGMVSHTFRDAKGQLHPGDFSLSCDWDASIDYAALFERWAALLSPELGMIHAFSPEEQLFDVESVVGEWTDFRRSWTAFQSGSFGFPLAPTIANIGWGMLYGGSFAALVDQDALGAAGFRVEAVETGWYVRVTGRLADSLTDLAAFAERRRRMKALFPPGTFLVEDEPFAAAKD